MYKIKEYLKDKLSELSSVEIHVKCIDNTDTTYSINISK